MSDAKLKIGWAQADITPDEPVLLSGQFHARVSEGVRDPVTATVLVLEQADEHAVFVTCDLSGAYGELQDALTTRVTRSAGKGRISRSLLPVFPGYVFFKGTEDQRVRALTTNRLSLIHI